MGRLLAARGIIQPKLRVGAINDPLEREADRIADQVMRMPEPTVQRACCASCASGASCADEQIRRDPDPGPVLPHGGTIDASLVTNLGPGQPLSPADRAFFEPRFGTDFSDVRLHTGPQAQAAARAINAHAFTHGRNIALGPARSGLETAEGHRLLAHELTHVAQHHQGRSMLERTWIRRQVERPPEEEPVPGTGAFAAARGLSLREVVESTHWSSPPDRRAFIRDYIRYAREHGLSSQLADAVAAYRSAGAEPEEAALALWLQRPAAPGTPRASELAESAVESEPLPRARSSASRPRPSATASVEAEPSAQQVGGISVGEARRLLWSGTLEFDESAFVRVYRTELPERGLSFIDEVAGYDYYVETSSGRIFRVESTYQIIAEEFISARTLEGLALRHERERQELPLRSQTDEQLGQSLQELLQDWDQLERLTDESRGLGELGRRSAQERQLLSRIRPILEEQLRRAAERLELRNGPGWAEWFEAWSNQLVLGGSGRVGRQIDVLRAEHRDQILAGMQMMTSSTTGGILAGTALALGADQEEAQRWSAIGDLFEAGYGHLGRNPGQRHVRESSALAEQVRFTGRLQGSHRTGEPATRIPEAAALLETAAGGSAAPSHVPNLTVSVNTRSGKYHPPGSRWHGHTGPHWRSMTLAEAEAAGYRRAAGGGRGADTRAPARSGVYSVERPERGDPRIVIRSLLGEAEARAGLEREMMSAAEYGIQELVDWERAHSQSAGLGAESGEAIRLAPPLVNQALQNRGVERYLREIRDVATELGEPIHLTTVTRAHPGTPRLASIHYVVEIRGETLFEAAIEVQRNGQAQASVRLSGDIYVETPWLAEE